MWIGRVGFAPAPAARYRGGVSLRRLRYQLRCAATGHDTRPYLVGGSQVEHRCLRCGALVGEAEAAASSAHGPDAPGGDGVGPQPSDLPPAVSTPAANGDTAAAADQVDDADDADNADFSALAALRELGELHASGVLTDREFARKKAELLRRV